VAATDYPGLGTNGIHPYLIGESEGRAVLDSVRAARDLPDSGATDRFAVWGHSQGGHAALYAGELAARDAPELKLVGVAAAAPATYLEKAEQRLQQEQFLTINPTKVEPWRSIMTRNSPGQSPAGAPVFIAQGTADTTVRPDITERFGEALCKQGTRVSFIRLPGVTHTFAAKDSAPAVLAWMTDRFQGAPAPSDCER
jgi:dipeptidyl aminopeptidase/acylaminoacyl peptidase